MGGCGRRAGSPALMPAASDHYDVIVIGSGPGGASLAHRLAATGKRILMLERGDYLPRSRGNWDSKTVFVDGAYQATETWYGQRRPRRSIPGCTISSAAIPRSTERPCSACASATSAKCGTRTASRRRGRSATTCSSHTTRRPRRCTTSTASAARIRPSPGPARPTPIRRSATSRASRQLNDILRARGAASLPSCRWASSWTKTGRQRHDLQPLHPLRRLRRLPLRDQRQGGRASDLRRPGPGGIPQFHAC